MKRIALTQGLYATIDEVDFDRVSSHKWHALRQRRGIFACTMVGKKPSRKRVYMHRYILGVEQPTTLVDHIDHNQLNNTRSNLRLATHAQNRHNSRANDELKTSKYLGVSYCKKRSAFVAQLSVNGKRLIAGKSKDENEAAILYNIAAKLHYGEFANLNVIDQRQ